ncbi:hypothetical protein SDC9_42614 [bioreactor metagenome]|jgi:sodium pump decarboxylase gamma subunit|uniref:Oxaloacetate decarboxylase gamma chain n=1 Tax=bioreactor metagenome TaxID=1076179 RepID=A0A644VY83_9ZZZZ|nr:OadG family protein [Paludibacter sp.]
MTLLAISEFEQIILYSVIGVSVVFCALIILVFAFKAMGNLSKKSLKSKKKQNQESTIEIVDEKELTGQEIAAISMALHLFLNDIHDEESNVITIKRIERRYSPWSSKIYGLTNLIR